MKLVKKIAIIVASVAIAASVSALAACSGSEANLTATYTSGTFSFFSSYPSYTFKQLTTSTQTIKTYDDNTYELTVTYKYLSGDLSFDASDSGNNDVSGVNDRGQTVEIYYGTYTSTEEEGLLTLTLNSPTDIIKTAAGNVVSGTYYYNTLAWTDDMGTSASSDGTALTAEQYVEANAFEQTTVVIDMTYYSFDYITLT